MSSLEILRVHLEEIKTAFELKSGFIISNYIKSNILQGSFSVYKQSKIFWIYNLI
jgi:hypothetical protein